VERSIAFQGPAVGDLRVVVPGERCVHLPAAASDQDQAMAVFVALQQRKDSRQRWVKATWRGKARLGQTSAT
jgi:hypothetical protein